MTGNVNLYHEVKDNNYLDLRKNKKLLSAIPEREDSLSLFTINKKIMENDEDSNRVLSLTKLENEMAVSVVESDVTNVNNIKRYSCDDNSNILFFIEFCYMLKKFTIFRNILFYTKIF